MAAARAGRVAARGAGARGFRRRSRPISRRFAAGAGHIALPAVHLGQHGQVRRAWCSRTPTCSPTCARWARRRAPRSADVFVSWLPLYHDMGLIGGCFATMYLGFPVVLMSPLAFLSRPSQWLRAIHRHRGTISGGAQLRLRAVPAPHPGRTSSKARSLVVALRLQRRRAGEPRDDDRVRRAASRDTASRTNVMSPVYGLAEARSASPSRRPARRGASIRSTASTSRRDAARPLPADDPIRRRSRSSAAAR